MAPDLVGTGQSRGKCAGIVVKPTLFPRKAHRGFCALSRKAGVSRATIDALENGRVGELGFSKLTKLLTALGLELKLQAAGSHRPTLDELMQEDRDDKSLDRRR
jgi:transcriptional regulator with XRE-family HTH domain